MTPDTVIDAESRYLKRLQFFYKIGYQVAEGLSEALSSEFDETVTVEIVPDTFKTLNETYWEQVERFKRINNFPDGRRINPPKRAALAIMYITISKGKFFKFVSNRVDPTYEEFGRLQLCVSVMQDFLDLSNDTPSIEHQRDFLVTLRSYKGLPGSCIEAVIYTLCDYMDAMWTLGGRHHQDDVD